MTNIVCLNERTIINIVNSNSNKYVFNGSLNYNSNIKYGLSNGKYIFKDIPSTHPMALLNIDVSNLIRYTGNQDQKISKSIQETNADGLYNFYYGDIEVTVLGNFGDISVYCYYHGYMGGEDLLCYSISCQLLEPEYPDSDLYTCIKHCPGGLHRRASGKLTYPSTQTGFPFSGNWNNPGSSITSVMRCVNKIQNVRKGSLDTIIYEEKYINNLGRTASSIGGYGKALRNSF